VFGNPLPLPFAGMCYVKFGKNPDVKTF